MAQLLRRQLKRFLDFGIQELKDASMFNLNVEDLKFIKQTMFRNRNVSFILFYSGSKDGWNAKDFHSRCDNKGPTMTFL